MSKKIVDCFKCINITDGTTSHRLKICYNELGQIDNAKSLVDGTAFTDATFLAEIEKYLLGETLTAGFVIEERLSCEVKTKFVDSDACFGDGTDLIVSGSVTEEVDAELGEIVQIVSFEVFNTNDATNLSEGEVFRAIDGDVEYVSGSYREGNLNIIVNGVTLEQMPCIECANC